MFPLSVLGWVFTALLGVLVAACVLARLGVLHKNHLFGVRLPALMRGEAGWRAGHAAGVVPAVVAFVVALVCAILGDFWQLAYLGSIAAFVGGTIWVMAVASAAARAAE